MKVERQHLDKHSIHTSCRKHRLEKPFHGSQLPGLFVTRFLKTLDQSGWSNLAGLL